PGDSVRVKGIVRRETADGTAIPKGATVKLVLRGPAEEALRTVQVPLSAYGTFDATLSLPVAGALGSHLLAASLGRNEITARFDVEEYQPAAFRVEVEAPPSAIRGERAAFDVRAEYLFGAPLAAAPARYAVTRSVSRFEPPNADGLVTSADAFYDEIAQAPLGGGPIADAEAVLGPEGSLRVDQPLALPGQRGPELVTFEVEVTDVARAAGAGRASLVVHPAEFYLGLAPIPGFVESTPARLQPKVAALTVTGERVAGKRVEMELVQRRWVTTQADAGGTFAETRTKLVDRVVARCEATSSKGASLASCPLQVPSAGYYLVRARAADSRGHSAEAAVPVYAIGHADSAFHTEEGGAVELVLDKEAYRVGEKARVLVKSPFPEAEALITVERAGILHRERRSLRGSMPSFEVDVAERLRPNAFVAVHLVRKATPAASQHAYRFGYAELKVAPDDQRLSVSVVPSARELRPGDEVSVDVSVRDARGGPARSEVTLYAVDEGVLLLTGYRVPDPLPVFTATRPLQVATLDTRARIARLASRHLEQLLFGSKGAEGGGGGGASVRRNFDQTAYFNPKLVTDANGRARARFRLPDSLTRYRVMAVAVGSTEQFGFGSSDVTTSKRLMARPALPRFVRSGDRIQAGVVVSTKALGPADVDVSVQTRGLVLEGAAQQRVRVEADGSREVRFAFRAAEAGRAVLRFDVRSGAERDSVEVTRSVQSPTVLEASAVEGVTEAAIAEPLGGLQGVRPDVGGLELSVAPSALVGLDASFAQLAEYPYGCTEQLASRLVPWLAKVRLGLESQRERRLVGSDASALRELVGRQRGDGGFGLWTDARQSHPWVSAYAAWVLHALRGAGAEVPQKVLDDSRAYLRAYLAQPGKEAVERATDAFALDVLASAGEPDPGYMNRLFAERRGLPLFARALLLHAMASSKVDAAATRELRVEIEAFVRPRGSTAAIVENTGDEYAVLMDSTARTQALVLRGLVASAPTHQLLPALARGLLAARRGGTWTTTQESAFALAALTDYRDAVEKEEPDFEARALLGDRAVLQARFTGRAFAAREARVPMAELSRQAGALLRFERDGRGRLFYQARLRYARTELPRSPLDAGFYVEKSLSRVDPAALDAPISPGLQPSASSFRAGDLVLADVLVVSSAPREYVAIDDPLPAGLEAINTALATTASRYELPAGTEPCADCPGGRDRIAEGRFVREPGHRRELHDDRVAFLVDHLPPGIHRFRYLARATTFGSFVVPPTLATGMYDPEIFGRTAATAVEVR
ncbi:MAG TPA: alpha-2-macroglobulin family protein, partial [Polyangiaceae bacterium]